MSVEGGKTGMKFFKDDGCNGVVSGHLAVYDFARAVEAMAYSTDLYAQLKPTSHQTSFVALWRNWRIFEGRCNVQRPF